MEILNFTNKELRSVDNRTSIIKLYENLYYSSHLGHIPREKVIVQKRDTRLEVYIVQYSKELYEAFSIAKRLKNSLEVFNAIIKDKTFFSKKVCILSAYNKRLLRDSSRSFFSKQEHYIDILPCYLSGSNLGMFYELLSKGEKQIVQGELSVGSILNSIYWNKSGIYYQVLKYLKSIDKSSVSIRNYNNWHIDQMLVEHYLLSGKKLPNNLGINQPFSISYTGDKINLVSLQYGEIYDNLSQLEVSEFSKAVNNSYNNYKIY